MTRQGQKQKGQFDVQPGMVFTMPKLEELHPNGYRIKAGIHPWLIVDTEDYYVEIVMCTTLTSDREQKHRYNKVGKDNTDIINPCPPMDKPEIRTSMVSLNTYIVLPKKTLFSNDIKICNDNTQERNFTTEKKQSLCLNEKDLINIRKDIAYYVNDNPQNDYDPQKCYDANDFFYNIQCKQTKPNKKIIQSYEKQFGWQHIKPANPYAIYPFEDQMYDYEKQDPELVKIARLKKQAIQKHKRKQQAEDKFGHIQVNNPNTGLGLGE